jgi:hypothetical protein
MRSRVGMMPAYNFSGWHKLTSEFRKTSPEKKNFVSFLLKRKGKKSNKDSNLSKR